MSPTTEMIRKSFSSSIKQASDRTFAVTISTGALDRDGDTIDPTGWTLDAYRKNPIVLFNHDRSRPAIARALNVQVQGDRLVAVTEFPPVGISPLADEIHGLVAAGFLHSTSVGFLPKEWSPNGSGGKHYSKAELLEFSVVNLPSQVEARILRCAGEACDEFALKSWLGTSCECDDAVLELAPSTYTHVAKEAGRLAREARRRPADDLYLEITETFDIDERALARGIAHTVSNLIVQEAAAEVHRRIRYYQGKVS